MQLTKLVVGLSLALGFVAAAAAQTTMRISISTAQNSHQGVAIDVFAKEVEKRTGGRYKVQTFYNGALGGERESIEAVQLGTQELAFSSSGPVPNFVPETKMIDDLLRDFQTNKIHIAIVVDEFGGTSGIVTLEDIMEEIIGEIKDEFDDEESGNKKIDEYTYVFEGKTMINDVCKAMNLNVDYFDAVRGESGSLAGLVLEIAGEFPQVNEEIINGNFIFTALEINKNRLDKVKVVMKPSAR